MFPGYVRSAEDAVFWLSGWFDGLGAEHVAPAQPVDPKIDASGVIAEIVVIGATASFAGGRRLASKLQLDRTLTARYYTFDLLGPEGRLWGWHGHPEPIGFHHRHQPPDFAAVASEPATFEAVAELVHRR